MRPLPDDGLKEGTTKSLKGLLSLISLVYVCLYVCMHEFFENMFFLTSHDYGKKFFFRFSRIFFYVLWPFTVFLYFFSPVHVDC